jgi:hypothetical protein
MQRQRSARLLHRKRLRPLASDPEEVEESRRRLRPTRRRPRSACAVLSIAATWASRARGR